MNKLDLTKLYDLAGDQVLALESALFSFNKLLAADYEMKFFFENQLIPAADKKRIFDEAFSDRPEIFRALVHLLIDNKLEKSVPELADSFSRLITEKSGVVFVQVRSAFALDKKDRELIGGLVGGQSQIREERDPRLLAGFTFLTSDGRYFDGTLVGQVKKMKEELSYA